MREMSTRRFSADALTAAARSKPWGESLIRRYRANIALVSYISGWLDLPFLYQGYTELCNRRSAVPEPNPKWGVVHEYPGTFGGRGTDQCMRGV